MNHSESTSPRIIIGFGFALVLALTVIMMWIALSQLKSSNESMAHLVDQNNSKIQLTNSMRDVVQLRTLSMQTMIALEDAFDRDEEMMRFTSYVHLYRTSRLKLLKIPQSLEEARIHEKITAQIREGMPFNNEAMTLLLEDRPHGITQPAIDRARIAQDRLLILLDELVRLAEVNAQNALAQESAEYEQARFYLLMLFGLVCLICVSVAVVVVNSAHKSTRHIAYQASHDALTDLINRREFEHRLMNAVKNRDSTKRGCAHTLLYMDLDNFKVVNDTSGHAAGDKMLMQVALFMKKHIRARDTLARLGGDEFALILENCPLTKAIEIAKAIRADISEHKFSWEDKQFSIGVSIGVVAINASDNTLQQVINKADSACYAAKRAGKNNIQIYSEDDESMSRISSEAKWVSRINDAIDNNSFRLWYQSIYSVSEQPGNPKHQLEVLLRLSDGDVLIPPSEFIPAAERYNMMPEIDNWVITNVLSWLYENPKIIAGLDFCTINLSGRSLGNKKILSTIVDLMSSYEIPGNKICFEVTEASVVSDITTATKFMMDVREIGCQFALDNFGSGVSSYGYLKSLPLDFLKIDGQFVRDIATDTIDEALVKSINEIAQVIGLKTIAESVEDDSVMNKLKELKIDFAQGFLLAKPLPIERFMID